MRAARISGRLSSVQGVFLAGGVWLGVSACGVCAEGICPGGCLGGCPPGGVYLGDVCQTPPVDRQAPVKILPCPKFRLRTVKTIVTTWHHGI